MNIITSTGNKPYNEFFSEALDYMEKYNIKGIALIILTDNYDEYKKYLISVHEKMKKESYETTNILKDILL